MGTATPLYAAATAEKGFLGSEEHFGSGSGMLREVLLPASASASRLLGSTLAEGINRLKLGPEQH